MPLRGLGCGKWHKGFRPANVSHAPSGCGDRSRKYCAWAYCPMTSVSCTCLSNGSKHRPPAWRTLRPGRQVAAIAFARIAKAHGQAGDAGSVVEGLPVHTHPVPQAVARGIIKGQPFGVGQAARCLANDEDARLNTDLKNRPWAEWQALAMVTGPRFGNERVEAVSGAGQWG